MLLQKLGGGFFANAFHPRNIIGFIAAKGFEIHHLIRTNAPFFHHLGCTIFAVAGRLHITPTQVQNADALLVINELK